LLWKKSKALGCGRKNTWNGKRPLYVCRYAKSAANFGPKAAGVNMPDYSREAECFKQYPVAKRWKKGGGGSPRGSGAQAEMNNADPTMTDGQGNATTGEGVEEEPAE
jgi:hypothetical protein